MQNSTQAVSLFQDVSYKIFKDSAMKKKLAARGKVMSDLIWVKVSPELKELAGEAADEMGIPLSELAAIALAEKLGRPDLGKVPRKKMGRRRKETVHA